MDYSCTIIVASGKEVSDKAKMFAMTFAVLEENLNQLAGDLSPCLQVS